jgi:hypothetical protein
MTTASLAARSGAVAPVDVNPIQEFPMTLVRSIFLALAVMLPTTWTIAKAADPAPAAEGGEKKEKKAKKGKKAEGGEKKEEEKK